MKVCLIKKPGSKAVRNIIENTPISLYKGQQADVLVNYGLPARRLESFLRRNPKAQKIKILNRYTGRSKYLAVLDAQKEGILCPESKLSLDRKDKLGDWIEKRNHSIHGNGIVKARQKGRIVGKYYQKMVKDRAYEIRVHAFSWLPTSKWKVQKRVGPSDQIAWNFHQGGHFQSIHNPSGYKTYSEAIDISKKILRIRKMHFGAVDFIVDTSYRVYFIEINSCPGFTELSGPVYYNAIKALTEMSKKDLMKM
jgi:hypothetical protein